MNALAELHPRRGLGLLKGRQNYSFNRDGLIGFVRAI